MFGTNATYALCLYRERLSRSRPKLTKHAIAAPSLRSLLNDKVAEGSVLEIAMGGTVTQQPKVSHAHHTWSFKFNRRHLNFVFRFFDSTSSSPRTKYLFINLQDCDLKLVRGNRTTIQIFIIATKLDLPTAYLRIWKFSLNHLHGISRISTCWMQRIRFMTAIFLIFLCVCMFFLCRPQRMRQAGLSTSMPILGSCRNLSYQMWRCGSTL